MISVIITCYNEGKLLLRAIDSLKKQTYKDFEVIIVKDLSNDEETIQVCASLEKEGYCVLYAENNVGVSVTRNMGIEKAKGDIIYTFDADDELPDDAIENVQKAFIKYPKADLVFGNYILDDWDTKLISTIDCSVITNSDYSLDIKKYLGNSIVLGNSPFRKSVWEKVDGYNAEFTFTCQDLDFHYRLLFADANFHYIPQILYHWYRKEEGINSSNRNSEDIEKCIYNNITLFESNFENDKYCLKMHRKFNSSGYKSFFYRKALEKGKGILSYLIKILPLKLLPYVERFL